MKAFTCILALFCLFSCKTTKNIPAKPTPENLEISLKKGGCFGKCPEYVFNIYKGGYCEFLGKKNTKKIGKHAKTLSKESYKEIKEAFEDSDYQGFSDNYESQIADLPTISISYMTKKGMKTITGKRERPERLHKLQFLLEQICENDKGWSYIGEVKQDVEEKKIEYIKSEIVLTVKDATQLARWFDDMRKAHSIRIVKPLSPETNTWLVSYDKQRYNPDEILMILRKDDNVSGAEFNIKTEKR